MSDKLKSYLDYEQREEIIRLSNEWKSSRVIEKILWVHHLTVCKIRKSYWFILPIKAWRKTWWHWTEQERKIHIKRLTKHWLRNSKFYKIYYGAMQRCNNPKATWYKNYWWRWIKIEWKSFQEYYDDMYDLYKIKVKKIWEDNISIERINVDWNYCKLNTTFIPKNLQSSNQQRQQSILYSKRKRFCDENKIDVKDKKQYNKFRKENK